jgi:hypothetical protein
MNTGILGFQFENGEFFTDLQTITVDNCGSSYSTLQPDSFKDFINLKKITFKGPRSRYHTSGDPPWGAPDTCMVVWECDPE